MFFTKNVLSIKLFFSLSVFVRASFIVDLYQNFSLSFSVGTFSCHSLCQSFFFCRFLSWLFLLLFYLSNFSLLFSLSNYSLFYSLFLFFLPKLFSAVLSVGALLSHFLSRHLSIASPVILFVKVFLCHSFFPSFLCCSLCQSFSLSKFFSYRHSFF